jgi:Ala-tRNA(Pro) deacylase
MIDRWLQYLNDRQIRYSHSVHPAAQTALETAEAEKVPAREFVKTVVYHGDAGFGIALVPADQFVDLTKIARMLGLSNIRLANEAELAGLFPDCEMGAMPPLRDRGDLPVTLDVALVGKFIAFTAGTHRDVLRLSFADFQRLAKPILAAIGMDSEVLI